MASQLLPPSPISWSKENPEKLGILVMRYLLAMVWLSQGLAKIFLSKSDDKYGAHNGFLGDLHYMAATNPIDSVRSILDDFLIPNHELILVLVIITELSIGTSLALGLFTRLGSFIGGMMTISLWVLTLGWDEWIWTYPLIFFPHLLFFLARSGKYLGIDRYLSQNFENKSIINYLQ